MPLASAFCEPLTHESKAELREALRAYRVAQLYDYLGEVQSPPVVERLGRKLDGLNKLTTELNTLLHGAPQKFWEIVDHWAITFLLNQLTDDARGLPPVDRALDLLSASFLIGRLEGAPLTYDSSYITAADEQGRVYGVVQNALLRFRGKDFSGQRLRWDCSGRQVKVRPCAGDQDAFVVNLPLQTDAPLELVPLTHARCWDLPVVEGVSLGTDEDEPPDADAHAAPHLDWQPLPLAESLERAHHILEHNWPEVIEWAKVLVPAFVDMGGVADKSVHRSATFGPGSPIFLTKVSDPFWHAEDIVHELQHERFKLLIDTSCFEGWEDGCQRFVSPYRTDPRPLRGLHLGIHAFLAVNKLRLRAWRHGPPADVEIYGALRTHRMNLFAFRTLAEHEQFSPEGKAFFAELARELCEQHEAIEPLATPEMGRRVDALMGAHGRAVRERAAEVLNDAPMYSSWNETARHAATLV